MVVQAYATPLLITFDGHLYIDHARALFSDRFWTDWDFLRTPLYPLYLRLGFEIGGITPAAITAVNTAALIAGLLALGGAASRVSGSWSTGAITVVWCLLCPVIGVYQSVALSELGTFFHLSLILLGYALLRGQTRSLVAAFILGGIVALGYYYRPTVIMAAPLVSVAMLVDTRWWPMHSTPRFRYRLTISALCPVTALLFALPWMLLPQTGPRADAQGWFAIVNQALIDPSDPRLGAVRDRYRAAIQESPPGDTLPVAGLPISGVRDHLIYGLQGDVAAAFASPASRILFEHVLQSPSRYAAGVFRSLLTVLSWPAPETDSYRFMAQVTARMPSQQLVDPGPPHLEAYTRAHFSQEISPPWQRAFWERITPLTHWILSLGFLASIWIFILGWVNRDGLLVLAGTIPLGFLGFHSAILFGLDRMGVPAYPLLLLNLSLVLQYLGGKIRQGQALSLV
jgi:hypothetical protein